MKRSSSGYTIVELMMSLTVLAIGASGIIAMQKVTLASNQYAKNLAVANGIAHAWADALAADASSWNNWNAATNLTETVWLQTIIANPMVWVRPAWNNALQFGPGFTALGDPVDTVNNSGLAVYCTDIRLGWLQSDNPLAGLGQPGAGLIRAEIRVFWKRENSVTTAPLPANICNPATNPAAGMSTEAVAAGYHFVYLTTAISQQPTG